MNNSNLAKRIGMSTFGVVFSGVAVSIFKMAAFGVDPFQSFMSGTNEVITISFGLLYIIINVLLLCFAFVFDRHYIGFATLLNVFLIGYIVDFCHALLQDLFGEISVPVRLVFLFVGVVVICFASSFCIVGNLGVSTYDAISLIISNTWGVIEFKYCRIITDLVCVVLGGILLIVGGMSLSEITTVIGIGTIITAFFMGPLIDFFIKHAAKPFLEYGNSKFIGKINQ